MAKLHGIKNVGEGFIEYNGEYYETQHESTAAQVGDIAQSILDNRWMPRGTFHPVVKDHDGDVGVYDSDGDFTFVGSAGFTLYRKVVSTEALLATKRDQLATLTAEIAQIEAQLAEESRLKVGDYARVTDTTSVDEFSEGDIVKVTRIDNDANYPIRGEGIVVDDYEWFSPSALTKITPAEARAALIAKIDAHFNPEGGAEPRE
ncbi:hypothetical protein MKY59_21505 [Paenibacillus sp. FSL W8-0426]|uniref:hypothetical protein n=1 Tax=Paenibacillus sp. FSL W8-0426 TaxID=2921714 RepID=UPI0030D7D20A